MNNKEFTSFLSQQTGYASQDVARMAQTIFDAMGDAFQEGETISVKGFGTFEVRKKMERIMVNPATGQRMLVPPKLVLMFKPHATWKKQVAEGNADQGDHSGSPLRASVPALLISALNSKHKGLTEEDAIKFVEVLFRTIREGLMRDKIVKVKGLGTFKIIGVDARESVNVNTGERVIIESHSKITFTPDATMREIVNKPFEQFETVALNDGVDFATPEPPADAQPDEEEPEEMITKTVEKIEPELQEQNVGADRVSAQPAAYVETPNPRRDGPLWPSAPEPQPEEEEPEPQEEEEEEDDEPSHLWRNILWTLLLVIVIGGAAFGGYIYGRYEGAYETELKYINTRIRLEADSVRKAMEAPLKDTPIEAQDSDQVIPLDATQIGAMKTEQAVVDPKKYEAMDNRIRTGAYRIVGTARTITVKKGQTLSQISRSYLGEGMECYVEVYNGIKRGGDVEPGSTLKIPKLELKRK